ncbi:MAG TPA: hypothetical protein VI685_19865 [Candidatus Angelobacter sp.]
MRERQQREIAEVRTTGGPFQCLDPSCGARPEPIDAMGVENERRVDMERKLASNQICRRNCMGLCKPDHVAAQALNQWRPDANRRE